MGLPACEWKATLSSCRARALLGSPPAPACPLQSLQLLSLHNCVSQLLKANAFTRVYTCRDIHTLTYTQTHTFTPGSSLESFLHLRISSHKPCCFSSPDTPSFQLPRTHPHLPQAAAFFALSSLASCLPGSRTVSTTCLLYHLQ